MARPRVAKAKKLNLFKSFKFINKFDNVKNNLTYHWKGEGWGIYTWIDDNGIPAPMLISLEEAKKHIDKGIWVIVEGSEGSKISD